MKILNYKIDKIVTGRFNLKDTDRTDRLRFSLSFQFKVSVDESVICCISEYNYRDDNETVMDLSLECYFSILDNGLKSLIKDNVLTIDTDTLQYLATIAVGTARGEIHARCEMAGSALRETVLPPVNLTKIITTPSEFYLNTVDPV
ncbi:MAG: hypothetical protein K2J18_00145 [Paramuribaculum sp.]|nr:hypothetical protein [Paramuribaculum sp.]MDE7470227.1 hypothetical protein [Paramuribaculum sp.]